MKNKDRVHIKKWQINIWNFYESEIIEILPPPLDGTIDALYSDTILACTREWSFIFLSQYLYKYKFNNIDHYLFSDLNKEFGLEYRFVSNFASSDFPEVGDKECAIIAYSKENFGWFRRIVAYGGASLPNIIYCVNKIDQDWLQTIIKWNSIFQKWYWLESSAEELLKISSQSVFICWTSDASVYFHVNKNNKEGILKNIEKIAVDHKLLLDIQNKVEMFR